jgi:hypothetical protein
MGADLYIDCNSCGGTQCVAVYDTDDYETGCNGVLYKYARAICMKCSAKFK